MSLDERDLFHEQPQIKSATFTCGICRHCAEYQVRWLLRTKKEALPPAADEQDRATYGKLRNYLIRVDNVLVCKRCQRTFEIPSQQSIELL